MIDPDKESARMGFAIAIVGICAILVSMTIGSLYELMVK